MGEYEDLSCACLAWLPALQAKFSSKQLIDADVPIAKSDSIIKILVVQKRSPGHTRPSPERAEKRPFPPTICEQCTPNTSQVQKQKPVPNAQGNKLMNVFNQPTAGDIIKNIHLSLTFKYHLRKSMQQLGSHFKTEMHEKLATLATMKETLPVPVACHPNKACVPQARICETLMYCE